MIPTRRGFLMGLGAALVAAPAVIRIPGLLMPIKALVRAPAVLYVGFWPGIGIYDPSGAAAPPAAFATVAAALAASIEGDTIVVNGVSEMVPAGGYRFKKGQTVTIMGNTFARAPGPDRTWINLPEGATANLMENLVLSGDG